MAPRAPKKRNYKKEAKYDSQPHVKKKRANRNLARRRAMRAGLVRKGDGKDVHHVKPLSKGGSNSKSNTRVMPKKANRAKQKGGHRSRR